MRTLPAAALTVLVLLAVSGCAGGTERPLAPSAPLRGFGIDVDEAVAPRLPLVHLRVCGGWGCHEQDVQLDISGPATAVPCPPSPIGSGPWNTTASPGPEDPAVSPGRAASARPAGSDVACGMLRRPQRGPGHGYAAVPQLTADLVTVTVTTPPGAPLVIAAEVRVRPALVCPGGGVTAAPTACADGVPQAGLRIAADGTVSQTR